MMVAKPILLVEPDTRLALLIARYLAGHGFDATILTAHTEICDELLRRRYACVLLEVTSDAETTCKLCAGLSVPVVPLAGRRERRPSLYPTRYSLKELLEQLRTAIAPARSE